MITRTIALFFITVFACTRDSQQATCDENEFKCADGKCIDSFLVCDGDKHCSDGSDEIKSVCAKTHIVCQPYAFRCAYGACIDGEKKCDGKPDCADNSDESHSDCISSITANTSNNTCSAELFRCDSGQCVSAWTVCDGHADCRDGSDESDTRCVNFPCPQIVGFQCSYGGCIDKLKQCNQVADCRDGSDEDPLLCGKPPAPSEGGSNVSPSGTSGVPFQNGCKLPRQPDGGVFWVAGCSSDDVSDKCRKIPGTMVAEYTSLNYSCIEGYQLSDLTNNVRFCINSAWYPETPLKCLGLCNPLKSSSVNIDCTYLGRPVNCLEPMLPETKAKQTCKDSYRLLSNLVGGELECGTNSQWIGYFIRCEPECGIKTGDVIRPLISKGTNTSAVEYPWYTGLYRFDKKLNKPELFCGGSIISPFMILTVAHCVVENKKILQASEVKVIVGKTVRDWDKMEPGEQRLNVSNIFVHNDYRGDDNHFAFDIAILELQYNIVIGRVSMPICIERIPPWTQLKNGDNGTVVGFGRDENEVLSDVLQVITLPYLDEASCKRRASVLFRKLITHDKFCTTYSNDAGVQRGDSGGGLVFYKPENGLYYLHGLVSTKPTDINSFATFTNISVKTHFDFIRETSIVVSKRHE